MTAEAASTDPPTELKRGAEQDLSKEDGNIAQTQDNEHDSKRVKMDDDAKKNDGNAQKHAGGSRRNRDARGNVPHYRARNGPNGSKGSERQTTEGEDGDEGDDGPRLPKKKCAIAFGYCGIGYSGLQINHGVKTIEGDIFEAFCKLGAVSKENAINPNKVGLQRAARTDRGVHAAGNLLTMKLILEPPGIGPNELVNSMNNILPEFIRIWGFTRVQNSFNARTSCDSRQYEYLLPTYVFLPPKPRSHMYNTLQQWAEKDEEKDSGKANADDDEEYRPTIDYMLNHPFWKKQGSDKDFKSDTAAKKQWRISMKQLDRVREIFSKYEGSHNFHNFTVGKPFRDRSAHRHMIKLTISDPKIINETEWVSIKFHGQSFMLHQIRKMIGLLVLVGRTTAPASLIPETFGPARIHVPKAPGLGLLLEEPIFGGYNRRLEETMKRQNEDPISGNTGEGGIRKESVIFSARYGDLMEQFKQKWIYDRIHQEEEEKHEYVKFLQYLDVLSGTDFEYLNPKGVIPQSAILKVGEQQRERPSTENKEKQNGEQDEEGYKSEEDDDEALQGNQAEMEG